MTRFIRRAWLKAGFTAGLAAASLFGAFGAAWAQAPYPSRSVRIVVPFPPGGPSDVLARMLGQKLGEAWGQTVVVDNRPGGNTVIAAENVARSAADGYTLLMAIDSTLVMNQYLFTKLPYDPVKDFAPITLLARIPVMLALNPSVAAVSIPELVSQSRAKPGSFNFGAGTITAQLAGEMFKSMTGADALYVPYKGSAPTTQALVAGEVQMAFDSPSTLEPHVKSGKLRALAVTGSARYPSLPQVPTFAEAGFPQYDVNVWLGLLAPTGTPAAVIAKVNADVSRALALPELRERLLGFGMEPAAGSAESFAALIKADAAKWEKPIKQAGIRLD